ncbi:hypothetical protein LAZ67_X003096 [Cordylochernes scorpioides]|uniref:Reverse transcriptase n=1 Tax=Cordylochernes scorpioides TaxID=51811 RepID=A0ABY6LTV8_9ARAC|nr:hypothetical protein LAZ67_X003096 [Cordylochernes scorpioides]
MVAWTHSQGILRVGGRLRHSDLDIDQKHPMLIPKDHFVTKLIVIHYHINNLHSGTQLTLSLIRNKCWIPSGRNLIKRVLNQCLVCLKGKPKAIHQIMGDLPKNRLLPGRPFEKIGIDLAGPIQAKPILKRSKVIFKFYIVLFVCFTTKAIHLGISSDLTAETFLAALKRFISRRGRPTDIYSDNATNFKGASNILKERWKLFNAANIQDFFAIESINWHFIPPSAPKFGGLWKAGIKSDYFWNRWGCEYLHQLQERRKWRTSHPDVNIGDLVMLKEQDKPLQWKLVRIVQIFPGEDDITRVVLLRTPKGLLKRPMTKICPLPYKDLAPAAPEDIVACIRCTKKDLWERPLLIIKQLEEHELMKFLLLGDFNSHHTLWGYSSTDNEGESLNDWMEINDMQLIFDAKKQGTFQSARWGKTYSPDLCFVTKDQCDNPIQIAHKILTKFPKSQHCPSIYEMGIQIPQIDSAPIPRWNLGKANWEAFTKYIEDNINLIPPTPKNYSRASNLIISCAKKFIPRGHRKIYIPCWSPESERLYQEYNLSGNTETAENLIRSLDDSRKHRWHTMLEQMDFSKSSRKSWSLLRKLGGADPPHKHNQLTNPNKIATCISSKSRIHPNPSEKSRLKKVIGTNLSKSSTHPQLSTNIDLNEVEDAIKVTHNNRAPGPDGIMPEFMKHLGQKAIKWMAKLFTNILSTGSIPSVWKQAKVLAILKPGKTSDDPNNYRPISLICIPYKILERIILNRISPIIEEYLPIEQAGFRPGRNCAEQTLALTTTIEDGFQKKIKTGAVFVDLTAAYDTVWREGLLYKLSKIINCKNIIKLINNFLTNRKITVHLNNKKSRPRTLNNGLPQGSVLAPLLFNVYTADIPTNNSQKFLYADDIALLHQEQSFSTLEQILNEDLKKLENFFSKWHLIPNPSKTVSSVFHLNNHKANRPLKLTFCNKPLSHDPCPKYLGVTLDRSLTFRQHLEKTRDKLKTRNNIMTRLAGTTWGCGADTLRTTALALVYSVAEYCAPVWERSSHTDSIDAQLNQTMRLITGNMRPTPIDWLPYLSNIAPPDLRRKKSTSNLLSKIKANTKLPINTVLEIPPPTRLISRNPAWVADENVDLKEEWRNRWSNLAIANKDLVEDPNTKPPGYNLRRRTWSTLNRIRTSTGRCNYLLNKWNMSPDQNCDCGQIQTMHHILRDCPRRFFQGTLGDIHRCTEEALEWIRHLDIPL